jgi:hypothetical protein
LNIIFVFLIYFNSFTLATETTKSGTSTAKTSANNLKVTSYGLAANCKNFLQSNGELGPWGKGLISGIERSGVKCFYEDIDFSYLCPKYSDFSIVQKKQFLAFLFATIAHYESSCNKKARAQGVNDIAVGLFQLEDSQRWRHKAGRPSPQCSPDKSVSDTYSTDFQLPCVAAMFSRQYCKSGKNPGKHSSYWHKLNPSRKGDRKITSTVKRFPNCK